MRRTSLALAAAAALVAMTVVVNGWQGPPPAPAPQDPIVQAAALPPDRSAGLMRSDLNVIGDDTGALQRFYGQFDALRRADRDRLVVFHVGDSHIEAPFFSAAVRASVAPWVGSAGRGVVIPKYRKRVVTSRKKVRYVMTSLEQPQVVDSAEFTLSLRTDDPEGFSRLTFIHEQGPIYQDMIVLDQNSRVIARVTASEGSGPGTTVVSLGEAYRSVRVRTTRTRPTQRYAQVYGVSLESGSGLLYHSWGIIGATAGTFGKSQLFRALMTGLKPDLVVVSLGTNDAMPLPYDEGLIRSQVISVVAAIRETLPDAAILMTTPAGSFRRMSRRRKPEVNAVIEEVRRVELEVARQMRCATWDLFQISGGPGAMQVWKDAGFAGADLVHFSKDGYELQGARFADALFKGPKSDGERRIH